VATSERILTTITGASDFKQRVSTTRSFSPSTRPVWPVLLADFATISLVLALAPSVLGRDLSVAVTQSTFLSPLVLALMITTLFAFVGTYPRYQTPLAIGEIEGLVRGFSCATFLLVIFNLGRHTIPGLTVVLVGGVVTLLLFLEREIVHICGRGNRSWLAHPNFQTTLPPVGNGGTAVYQPHHQYPVPGRLLKRAIDLGAGTILLALVTPLFVLVARLIKIDSKGPVFIRQRRVGKGGAIFLMWKFRSMRHSETRYERSPASDADPRLTNIGKALRRLSIDELPQLLNVVKGDMSLVGPRPEMPFIVAKYGARERLRLNAIPGITGLWQISPARAMPIHQNLEFDFFYIERQSFFLDVAIMLRTITAVIRGIGAA
jgi:lipopolysaccharide/colanic/teichoic acid biosynthesis glycosyltransferase